MHLTKEKPVSKNKWKQKENSCETLREQCKDTPGYSHVLLGTACQQLKPSSKAPASVPYSHHFLGL